MHQHHGDKRDLSIRKLEIIELPSQMHPRLFPCARLGSQPRFREGARGNSFQK